MILLAYLTIYFLLVFVTRSFLLWKKTGINPLTFKNRNDAHGYNGFVFKLILILEWFVVGLFAFSSRFYEFLLPFWYLESDLLRIIGWILMIFSLVWVWIAQGQMNSSWRIGVDEENKAQLITSGLFSISRNPIFFGIIITNLGLFLVIPNAFTLLILMLSSVSINTQIRLEEAFLIREFGDSYGDYCKLVSRWI